ncbi:50S ribosomal protein L28 [Mycoplasma tauri]|uniref:Large ribosomal subunit protein bL28 n=1 Tax=Mycoplasma tauri TaxID=547987 RepID=A0A953NCU8_9MOLU|nr:50S ribosomal protein L28 [Mycoplasma tauri]MBZ4195522.1 50S ribosomal protein L28 [Mycoplasma tauri]MBZ4203736.1 50S ribosomal protein L28 [Mycoplasma tauri]MBZ4204311.1 50S ribosomal protein L28 [Mycoplasma tauri]MBZ4212838.1 50S ribosomal protein L28 [Mycoplasma tauri]MBZ4218377.1 50S ribosomal protein L28 [Mycoplasma tauri]
MARRDQLSNRGPLSGNLRSHSMIATKRKFNVNLQKITITNSNGTPTTLKVSAKTIKTLKRKGILSV